MTHKKQGQLTSSLLTTLGIPAIFIPGLILASLLGWISAKEHHNDIWYRSY
jgi:hypothetical protein